jgi:AraC-like DNA-binding protein
MGGLSFNIYNILILIGCVQGLLLALLLVRNNSFRKTSNLYLALAMVSFSLSNFHQVLLDIRIGQQYTVLLFLPLSWGLLIPFAFYFFVQYLIHPHYRAGKLKFWLLLPFIVHAAVQLIELMLFLFKPSVLYQYSWDHRNITVGIEIFSIFFSLVILFIMVADIARYQKNIRDYYSTLSNKTLSWLQNLMYAMIGLWFFWSVPYLYEVFTNRFLQWHHYPLWIGMSVVVYWIGYSTHSRKEVFLLPDFIPSKSVEVKEITKLSDKTEEHHQRLLKAMEEKRPYLNPELNLEMLAAEIDLSAGYLSQIINTKEGVNFYDFINRFRVEEAKKMMGNPAYAHYSILAIGLEAGFNSKSTFNTAFKKYSGTTPSSFKKQIGSVA